MCDFIYNWWFIYKNVIYDGDGRKTPKYKRENKKQWKKFSVWLPSRPHVYEMDADCFLAFENTENKPDLP